MEHLEALIRKQSAWYVLDAQAIPMHRTATARHRTPPPPRGRLVVICRQTVCTEQENLIETLSSGSGGSCRGSGGGGEGTGLSAHYDLRASECGGDCFDHRLTSSLLVRRRGGGSSGAPSDHRDAELSGTLAVAESNGR